jgi:iron complex outermembrane receptor protein
MLTSMTVRGTLIALACAISMSAHAIADTPKKVEIPPGELRSALLQLSKAFGVELVYQPEQLKDFRTGGIKGTYTPEAAVRILLKGTPLELRTDPSGAMLIAPAHTNSASDKPSNAGSDEVKGDQNKSFWDRFRVAQVDQGQTSGPSAVETKDEQGSKKRLQLEEVIVTGSRIPQAAKGGAQDVKVYDREQIEQSGQTTIADFANTLTSASLASTENGFQTSFGATTIQLHGLPVGTTLVLIDGRQVQVSGAQAFTDVFDLNNIPLAAVERIEVLPVGSSAVYGSSAIAGVVNIILKKHIDGLEADAKYGFASGTHEWDTSLGWGQQWSRGSIAITGSFQTRTPLEGFDRSITANQDHRAFAAFGGYDARSNDCNPGNVFTVDGSTLPGAPAGSNATFAAISPSATGNPRLNGFSGTYGILNACSLYAYSSFIPATRREGLLATGSLQWTPSVELFTELMFSHVEQKVQSDPPELFGVPGFTSFTVPASNPYNPFGETVGISGLLTSLGSQLRPLDQTFFRGLVGARGDVFGTWHWELAAWDSEDHADATYGNFLNSAATQTALNSTDPATALNPFVAGAPGSPQLLQSLTYDLMEKFSGRNVAANGFVRGPALQLPSGPVDVVLGGEYRRESLYSDFINAPFYPPNTVSNFHRNSYAFFGEARIPLLSSRVDPKAGDTLAATLAERYDNYQGFGGKSTPQFGLEWRPSSTLLVRGTYGRAFKAPTLSEVFFPTSRNTTQIVDPLRGNQVESVLVNSGGNLRLHPETGESRTLGFAWSSKVVPNLQLSATYWRVTENNGIQSLGAQALVDNENVFPGSIVRAASCNAGPPCPITQINATYENFGEIDVSGFDYQLNYNYRSEFGEFAPSLSVTQTNEYKTALTPGSPSVDVTSVAVDFGSWSPRWKGTAALGWKLAGYSANLDGRYVGRYQDYGSTREIGNFWLYDANVRYAFGENLSHELWARGMYIEVGAVNLFNTLPQYSNYYVGLLGYDAAQADLRGRFLYMHFGGKW